MKVSTILVFTLFILPWGIRAQDVRFGYYGESITHYGAKVGYQVPVFQSERTRKNEKTTNYSLLAGGSLAGYRHPHHHIGVIASPDVTLRRTGQKGRFMDITVSPAVFRYFYEGVVYEFNGNGFDKVPLAGRTAFLPTIGIGGGRDFSVQKGTPIAWYWRANVMRQYPYNISSLTRISLEVGLIKKLKNTKQ